MHHLEFQSLWHRVVVRSDDAAFLGDLQSAEFRRHHAFPPVVETVMTVRHTGEGRWSVYDGPDQLTTTPTRELALEAIDLRVTRRMVDYASLCGWVQFEGALVTIDPSAGAGVVVVGVVVAGHGVTTGNNATFLSRDGLVVEVPRRAADPATDGASPVPVALRRPHLLCVFGGEQPHPVSQQLSAILAVEQMVDCASHGPEAPSRVVRAAVDLVNASLPFHVWAPSYAAALVEVGMVADRLDDALSSGPRSDDSTPEEEGIQ
jgi:hypothetical protein